MSNPILFALDVESDLKADKLCRMLAPYVGGFKIGLQLWNQDGPDIVDWVLSAGGSDKFILLDLKLHDIPATVGLATKAVARLRINGLTVHVGDDAAGIKAALDVSPSLEIFAITVLTSVKRIVYGPCDSSPLSMLVENRFKAAMEVGATGAVCSGQEVGMLRKLNPGATLIVPGVRLNQPSNDQKRVVTPKQAIDNGANWIVVGREIRDAADPAVAAQKILETL